MPLFRRAGIGIRRSSTGQRRCLQATFDRVVVSLSVTVGRVRVGTFVKSVGLRRGLLRGVRQGGRLVRGQRRHVTRVKRVARISPGRPRVVKYTCMMPLSRIRCRRRFRVGQSRRMRTVTVRITVRCRADRKHAPKSISGRGLNCSVGDVSTCRVGHCVRIGNHTAASNIVLSRGR